ncbi:MAG: hypothetical protein K9J12_05295 [Melioribacteraceae bacterium]|nr:hypothetical protein [Melioribacteraceae bacterium]MCF8262991.1 hypothetical protein [Melioribacteraceae bacterium]
MSDCKNITELFEKALYEELNVNENKLFNSHLQSCNKCKTEYLELTQTLKLVRNYETPEPDANFMDDFWLELQPKLKAEKGFFHSLFEKFRARQKVGIGYQLAGAFSILLVGILLGKIFFTSPNQNELPGFSTRANDMNVIQAKADNYIQRSKVLLLGLMNFDPEFDDAGPVSLMHQKRISSELITQAAELKKEINPQTQKQLKRLIDDIEIILMQIANLETEYDLSGIDLIQSGVERKGILLKINIRAMQESDLLQNPKNEIQKEERNKKI